MIRVALAAVVLFQSAVAHAGSFSVGTTTVDEATVEIQQVSDGGIVSQQVVIFMPGGQDLGDSIAYELALTISGSKSPIGGYFCADDGECIEVAEVELVEAGWEKGGGEYLVLDLGPVAGKGGGKR